MKTILRAAVGAAAALLLGSGCAGGPFIPPPPPMFPQRVVSVTGRPEDAAVMAEIDGAARMYHARDRKDALLRIASRPNLPPASQVYLVNTALRAFAFDTPRVEILRALSANPSFSAPAKESILWQMQLFNFASSQRKVMQALQQANPRKP